MIIPVRCFTCGNILADKYMYYIKKVNEMKLSKSMDVNKVVYLTKDSIEKTPEAIILDELNMKKMCCRRHMLTHVDIE